MTAPLTKQQVAAIMCVTVRRIEQMDVDGDGPPRSESGRYPASLFGEWLKKRTASNAKERLAEAQADIAEMEAAELAGDLCKRAAMREQYGQLVETFRARSVGIAPTAAPLVAAPGKTAEAQAIIEKLVYEALAELAGDE